MEGTRSDERYLLWLTKMVNGDSAKFRRICKVNGTAADVFDAAKKGALKTDCGLAAGEMSFMTRCATEDYIDDYIAMLKRDGISFTTPVSDNFPKLLSEIYDPPTTLFYKGRLPADIPLALAMIGARACTDYGRELAVDLSRQLSERGVCIVSGMALGIDAASSYGALLCAENEFPTAAVLGAGVDVVYPKTNAELYYAIIERGAVISEYLPGTQPLPSNFPRRNRIISGMSRGVIIVEAAERSGTSITASYALEQNRDVFCVPGRITDKMSRGTNELIREGVGKPIFGISDILEEYGYELTTKQPAACCAQQPAKRVRDELSGEQLAVYDALSEGAMSFDELCVRLKCEASKLNICLTEMEFSRIIKQSPGRVFEIE